MKNNSIGCLALHQGGAKNSERLRTTNESECGAGPTLCLRFSLRKKRGNVRVAAVCKRRGKTISDVGQGFVL